MKTHFESFPATAHPMAILSSMINAVSCYHPRLIEGYSADTFIERDSGKYELTETRQGLAAVMNDLHKGRDTGAVWAGIIDVSAGLMVLVSLTGLALIFFLQKRRMSGLIAVGIGGLLCWLVYLIFVP